MCPKLDFTYFLIRVFRSLKGDWYGERDSPDKKDNFLLFSKTNSFLDIILPMLISSSMKYYSIMYPAVIQTNTNNSTRLTIYKIDWRKESFYWSKLIPFVQIIDIT